MEEDTEKWTENGDKLITTCVQNSCPLAHNSHCPPLPPLGISLFPQAKRKIDTYFLKISEKSFFGEQEQLVWWYLGHPDHYRGTLLTTK